MQVTEVDRRAERGRGARGLSPAQRPRLDPSRWFVFGRYPQGDGSGRYLIAGLSMCVCGRAYDEQGLHKINKRGDTPNGQRREWWGREDVHCPPVAVDGN